MPEDSSPAAHEGDSVVKDALCEAFVDDEYIT
jgi:hypothetical protein